MTQREPSMFDVARRAGVSHQTVSRVLNEHPNVRESTRLRVRTAIADLGYRPNRAARALATGRYQSIGIVAPPSTLFGPVSLLAAFEERAAGAGFTVTVGRVPALDKAAISEAVQRHLDQRVAAIVVIAPVASAAHALAGLALDIPLVTIDGDPSQPGAHVTVDQAEGARLATRLLLDAGHETVWHVSGPPDWFDAAGRILGWREELTRAGREVPPTMAGDWSAGSGFRAGELLAGMPEVSAVFVANDAMALGVLRALSEAGRRVPDDVSVVGFDDVPEAAYFLPPLTTVHQDFDAVAREALALVLEQVEGAGPGERRTVAPVIVPRESVGRRA